MVFVIIFTYIAWSTQQASSMHLKHETTLLSTPLPFWTLIITVSKMMMINFSIEVSLNTTKQNQNLLVGLLFDRKLSQGAKNYINLHVSKS